MHILTTLNRKASFMALLTALGIINSALYTMLLLFINNAIGEHYRALISLKYDGLLFFGLMIFSYLCRRLFQGYMIRLSNVMLFDLEISILEKIKSTAYEVFSQFDVSRIYTAMADIKIVSQVPRLFIDVINNGIILLICIAYLFWISVAAATGILIGGGLLLIFYYLQNKKVMVFLKKSRDLENGFYRYLNDLLTGFKEIKMDSDRNANIFHKYLKQNRSTARNLEVKAAAVYMNNELMGNYGWFFLMGLLVFILPHFFNSGAADITRFIVVILYLMAPISLLTAAIPFISKAHISMKRIEGFCDDIRQELPQMINATDETSLPGTFDKISFEQVQYQYNHIQDDKKFALGPISLNIHKGEMIFITGENGSGKSTFLLLLCGLLQPASGTIYFNNKEVLPGQLDAYRNKIAVVFVNGLLFSENYNSFSVDEDNERRNEWFELMKLRSGLVPAMSANIPLSKGQQKRLALIYALMEDKEILVLDEWAAEQDPAFRAYFYKVVLKELQQRGKTIIAVTHDDKYFSCADSIIRFESGRIIQESVAENFLYHE